MQQRPQRERIIRPTPEPRPPQNEQPPEDGLEDLTQDELNEWLTQKVIQLEREQMRRQYVEPNADMSQPIPLRKPPIKAPQRPKQPYEENYTSEEKETPKKKKRSTGSMIALFVGLILVAILIINIIGILIGYQLPF